MESYYDILGVQENADQDSIKKAYRTMAKRYHPDRNKDAGAEERFKKITEAYENIGDDSRRGEYDRKRSMHNSFFSGYGFNSNFNDPFASHYNAHKAQDPKGSNLNITLKITLDAVLKGVTKKIKLRRDKKCNPCGGSGALDGTSLQTCGTCNGAGQIMVNRMNGFIQVNSVTTCHSCNGSGKAILEYCLHCLGKGLLADEDVIDINIPAGSADGMQFVVQGKGNEGKGNGIPGDLYVKIKEILDDRFTRRGIDLISSKEVTFIDAVLGTNIDVDMPDGENVKTIISPGTLSGTILKFSQKGIPNLGYGGIGDFLVEINIKVPNNISEDEKKFLDELRTYDMFK
jgi:molecular chaperone DnaJ